MKKILLLFILLIPFITFAQTPPHEDIKLLKHPLEFTEIYIGHKNCQMMYIFQGKGNFGDMLYFTNGKHSILKKVAIPENLAKKKNLVFLFKTETGAAFAQRKSKKQWFTFYFETMTWLTEKKMRGHDGEDRID